MDNATLAANLFGSSAALDNPEPSIATVLTSTQAPEVQPSARASEPTAEPPQIDVAKLYPNSPPDEPEQAATEEAAQEPPALDVNKHLPDAVRTLREEDTPRKLYSPQQTYSSVIPDDMFEQHGTVPEDMPQEVQAAIIHEYREMAADTGLSSDDVRLLKDRTLTLRDNPVPPELQQAEARVRLAAEFGADGIEKALKDANALLNRDPRVRNLLHGWGLGDDPDTVVLVARAAARQRAQGRLK
ncbi:hypothetical protein CEY09_05360 [Achromobacter marplatensis]|uniref:Uncharacterized protein n=1 Tax=Achromobacter marplatensis TaxID=470868 RepID=A0ABX9GIC9_9BURK|nr:hypothetical protein [Achromobacter marplatensis]OWT70998.1 hypothetical protein CEY09_05360 [Achromobacter marplatensis]RBP22617.1 hypothetical protein DFP87_102359 [Achromobacter marplatensis]CAB3648611.1 hypothetical protein LMG26219_02633 [Achromobacter marplatensis]